MDVRTEFGRYGVVFNLHCEDMQEVKDIHEALELLANYLYNEHGRRNDSYRIKELYSTLSGWIKSKKDKPNKGHW